jgi:hypothetical protein
MLTPDQLKDLREKQSYLILPNFEKWLLEQSGKELPKSLIGQAILYMYNIYPRLVRYVLDCRYNIDNNGAENKVRALALGRKNTCSEKTTWQLNGLLNQSVQRLGGLLPMNWEPVENN